MAGPTFDDVQFSTPTAPPPDAPVQPNQVAAGLRSSATAYGGDLTAIGARAAEGFGADELAKGLYAKSAAMQQQAAAIGPRITDPSQIGATGNYAEDALDYGAGLVGSSIIPVATGLAGGFAGRGGGAVGRIAGATLATAPQTIGDQILAQQADPTQAAAPLADRNLTAGAVGLGQAGILNVVPQVIGGKLVGNVAERIAGRGAGGVIAKNLAEGVGGNALAGAASEKLAQEGATHLNPNRDTSDDDEAVGKAALGQAVPGALFGAAGAAGELAHTKYSLPANAVDLEALRKAVRGETTPTDADHAVNIAQGGDLVDDAKLATASPDDARTIIKQGTDATVAKVQGWASDLADKASDLLTDDQKATLAQASTNLADKGNQAKIVGLKVAADGVQKARDIGSKLAAAFGDTEPDDNPALQSNADAGPQRALAQALIQATGDDNAPVYAPQVANAVKHAEVNGKFGARDTQLLTDSFGDKASDVLEAARSVVGDDKKNEQFASAVQGLDEHIFKGTSLRDTVTQAIDPSLTDELQPEHVQALVQGLKDYVGETHTQNMGPAEATLHRTRVRRELQKAFGDQTDDVIARFAEDAHSVGVANHGDETVPRAFDEKGEPLEPTQSELEARDRVDPDHLGPENVVDGKDAVETRYYGGGRDKKAPEYLERPDVHRARPEFNGSESQAERVFKAVKDQNPDRDTSFISARDHAAATGLDEAALNKATDGRPDDHVLVQSTAERQEGKLTAADVDGMRLDTKKYPDSKSRVDTGKAGETFDAVKMVEHMKKTLGYTAGDDTGNMARTKRAFQEGIAALSDHLGKNVSFADDTKVDRKGTTVADLKKVKTDTASKDAPGAKFAEMTDSDVRRTESQLEMRVEKAVDARVKELEDAGATVSKEERQSIRDSAMQTDVGKAYDEISQERERRDQDKVKEQEQLNRSRTEVGVDEDIHTSAASNKAADLVRKDNKVSNAGRVLKADNTISKLGREQISSKASQLEAGRTAISRSIGAKLRGLEGRLDDTTPHEQALLLRATGAKVDIMKTAETINELAKKYPATETKASLVSRAESHPDEVIANVAKSNDYGKLKDGVTKLLDAKRSDNIDRVVNAMNDRLDKVMQDNPDAHYNYLRDQLKDVKETSVKGNPNQTISAADRKAVEDHITKVLGPSVDVQFAKMLHGGEFEKADKSKNPNAKDILRVSVHALDLMSVAAHESLHAFMELLRASGDHNINRVLFTAADTHVVRNQLRELLKNSPEALKQIESSAEERAAYMYQFWSQGKLNLGPKATGVLGKIADFFKSVLGIWSNDDRALHIMEYFNSGEYAKNIGDRGALDAAFKKGTNDQVEAFKKVTKPIRDLASAVAGVGEARLRDTQVPALIKLADLVHSPTSRGAAEGDTGYINASRVQYTKSINDLSKALKPYSVDRLNEALESLQTGKPAATPEAAAAAREIRTALDKSFDYMEKAGVKIGDLGYGKDYFPRVWDTANISKNQTAFKAMLQKYKDAGHDIGDVNQVMASIIGNGGSELGVERVMPGMQHTKTRVLKFITGDDAAPFLNKDLYSTMNSYMQQAARRGEWARRFGDNNEKIAALMKDAKNDGATPDQLDLAKKYLNGVNGTLGDDINPTYRRLFSNTLVYENIRLLGLGIFSSAPDAAGIFVRGGTVSDAFSTFKRGIAEVGRGFKDPANRKPDAGYDLAEDLGVIDSAMLQHTVGSAYSQDLGGFAKKVSEGFFKYNLMDQYNRSMRVGATIAATKFIAKHADGYNTHSQRYMDELGLKKSDVVVKNGDLLITQQHFLDAGYSPAEAAARSNVMAGAVNKWVDGAILRPNAAQKPIYFNDPHFALISHLKQFVFSFQENILKRVVNEAKHGNYTPALGLASYVPIMIAADAAKGLIQGGGSQPDWKQGWDAGDYLWSGVQRAGLLGVGQFGADALVHKSGVLGLLGPTIEHLGEAMNVAGGRERFGQFALKSMPANALAPLLESSGGGGGDPSPNFAD